MNEVPRARCQCLATCPKDPLPGKAFCAEHATFCPRRAPTNGWEPKYEPDRWNSRKEVRLTHNCFSYAMNIMDTRQIKACLADPKCDTPFHQPGSISGYPKFNDKDPKTCPNMIARLMGDNPTILPSAFELACPAGTSKIALVVDEDQDYHFLRQDAPAADANANNNTANDPTAPVNLNDPQPGAAISQAPIGFFSQKSGALPVTNKDAFGHEIFDVQLANHDFNRPQRDRLNYDRFCGYFCVPRDRPLFVKIGGRRRYPRTRRRASSARRR